MKNKSFISYLLNPKNWWLPLLIIFSISIIGVTSIGIHTYTQAPPIPNYTSTSGQIIIDHDDVLNGQAIFLKYALMEYGSMFGDGALRGPDFTAEALHYTSKYMNEYYLMNLKADSNLNLLTKGIAEQVKAEIKRKC